MAIYNDLPSAALLPWACTEARKPAPKPVAKPEDGDDEDGEDDEPAPALAPKNKVKYTCPKCKANAWGKPMLMIGCADVTKHEDGEAAIFESA